MNEEDENKLKLLMVDTEKERIENFNMENEIKKLKKTIEESEKKYLDYH